MLLAFFRLMARLPLPLLHWMGRITGLVVYAWPGRYRQRLRANARQAGYCGCGFTLRAAAQTGAMVFVTPHLGCFEITARHLTQYGPITVMYRRPRMALLEPVMAQARNMAGLRAVPASMQGVRSFVRALRRGEAIGLLPDQVPRSGDGVWADFFGRPAYTMTLAGKLAQLDVEVVLTVGERLAHGRGWRIHYTRLAHPLPSDPHVLACMINQAMESLIRQFPEQYLWSYNRYKVPNCAPRPPDYPNPTKSTYCEKFSLISATARPLRACAGAAPWAGSACACCVRGSISCAPTCRYAFRI
jgi:KDO2-lipid IV(A) lauroyltransferase